eukprot:gene12717-26788_t
MAIPDEIIRQICKLALKYLVFLELKMVDNSFSQSLDRLKESFLWAAAQGGNTQDCESLIEIGADVNWRNNEGDTPLLAACRRGHIETAITLIVHGADVNAVGEDSFSPLHICCRRGNYELLNVLLDAHANTKHRTTDGELAIDIAKNKGYDDICNRLNLYNNSSGNISLNTHKNTNSNPSVTDARIDTSDRSESINNAHLLPLLSPTTSTGDNRRGSRHSQLPALHSTSQSSRTNISTATATASANIPVQNISSNINVTTRELQPTNTYVR